MAAGDIKQRSGLEERVVVELGTNKVAEAVVPIGLDGSGNAQRLDDAASRAVRVYQAGAGIIVPTDIQRILRSQYVSTATPLAISASFTGDTLDVRAYRGMTGRAFADQAGTLYIEHSDDGTAWDVSNTIAVSASTPVFFDLPMYLYYARVRFVNGATAQTTFRLDAWLRAI